jgi:hypothetical protein
MKSAERTAFEQYLRTGRRTWAVATPVQQKFNPYHDAQNGQFTFGPGGGGSVAARLGVGAAHQLRPASRRGVGGNGGPPLADPPLNDPMTLERVFPALISSPAGAIVGLVDNMLDLTGPSQQLNAQLTRDYTKALIGQIQVVDPSYRFESLGEPTTLEGQANQIRQLRLDRAAIFYRVKGDVEPLQVETLRFLQKSADQAYIEGEALYSAGRLKVRLSREEAIGNFVDRRTRRDLQDQYNRLGFPYRSRGNVRVIGREYNTSGADRTYRVPDARVGNVAFDVSLTRKTLKTPQVRGFFNSDFKPDAVVIIRPSQLGPDSTYIITRPGH